MTISGTPDTTPPLSQPSRLFTNAGSVDNVDAGDVMLFMFNEEIAVAGNASFRFSDKNSKNWQFTNGVNATMSLNATPVTLTGADAGTYAANRVLTVTVTGDPNPISGTTGADLPAQYPFDMSNVVGIGDPAGNVWDVTNSTKKPPTAASLVNQGITWTAKTPGAAGNSITIQLIPHDGNWINVGVAGNEITVNYGEGNKTPNDIRYTVNSHSDASNLVTGAGGVASVYATPLDKTPLSGGADPQYGVGVSN